MTVTAPPLTEAQFLRQVVVLALIGRGRDTARTIGDLAETLNRPRRSVEQAIQRLRVDGWAISSGSEGVWLADLEDIHHATGGTEVVIPPEPGTDAYKALPAHDKAAAKAYWATQPSGELAALA